MVSPTWVPLHMILPLANSIQERAPLKLGETAPGGILNTKAHHNIVLINKNGIDSVTHAKHMNRGTGLNPQPAASWQGVWYQEAL
jgi:hypothetical protein